MGERQLKVVWKSADTAVGRDVLAFWRENKLLPDNADPEKRLNELSVVAYEDGKIVGVHTASIEYLERVRARIAMGRLAVAPSYRRTKVASELVLAHVATLERWSLDHPEEALMGVGGVVQAAHVGREPRPAAYPMNGMTLVVIGYTPHGEQIRLAWFPHARIK